MTPLEKAARAICSAMNDPDDPIAEQQDWEAWAENYRSAAIAVLDALEEPSLDMLAAGMERWSRHDDAEEDVDGIWRAMIRAAKGN